MCDRIEIRRNYGSEAAPPALSKSFSNSHSYSYCPLHTRRYNIQYSALTLLLILILVQSAAKRPIFRHCDRGWSLGRTGASSIYVPVRLIRGVWACIPSSRWVVYSGLGMSKYIITEARVWGCRAYVTGTLQNCVLLPITVTVVSRSQTTNFKM